MAHKVLCTVTEDAHEAMEFRQRDKKEHHQDKGAVSLCVEEWKAGRAMRKVSRKTYFLS